MPRVPASTTSRRLRRCEDSRGVFWGRKNSASISRIMVTTSTESWVSARSGAEKRAKVSDTTRPTTESMISEIRR